MTNSVVYHLADLRHPIRVMDTDELLARLKAKGIKNVEIARALGLPESRIPEIKKKTRAVKLDEAATLVRAFRLEQTPEAEPLPESVLRLLVRHVARRLDAPVADALLLDLAKDLRAFSVFAANPKVRGSVEAAEGFFQALQLRPEAPSEDQPENDPERTH